MLPEEKITEVLEAYNLTQSLRSAGMLCEADHHAVARCVWRDRQDSADSVWFRWREGR